MYKYELSEYLKRVERHLKTEGKGLVIRDRASLNGSATKYADEFYSVEEFNSLLLHECDSTDDVQFIIYDNKIVVDVPEGGWEKGEAVGLLIVGEGN
jgi:hypothetical protein